MGSDGFKRKLSVILSADVVGYSRLMRDNQEETVRTLNTFKKNIFSLIEQNHGRVVDSPGDNLLAEFESVVDTVNCAIQIQDNLKKRNETLPENRKMEFRIGINIGDVIIEDNKIYGDGINVAARIESLTEPGGICISRSVYEQVKRMVNIHYDYLGEYQVKNIDEPVHVYKVLMKSEKSDTSDYYITIGIPEAVGKPNRNIVFEIIGLSLFLIIVIFLIPESSKQEVINDESLIPLTVQQYDELKVELNSESSDLPGIYIKEIIFNGNSLIDTDTLRNVVKPFLHRRLTIEDMNNLADAVTIFYSYEGYMMAIAYITEQEINDGTLSVNIDEGGISLIYLVDMGTDKINLLQRFLHPIRRVGSTKNQILEELLLKTKKIQGVELKIILKPEDSSSSVILEGRVDLRKKSFSEIYQLFDFLTIPLWLGIEMGNDDLP